MTEIRKITANDDAALKTIIQSSLKAYGLDIPGTAYFDPELGKMSRFYDAKEYRDYFVALSGEGEVYGGSGFAEYDLDNKVVELQKVYLSEASRGQGLSYQLIELAMNGARDAGYKKLYIETHHKLESAIHVYEKLGFRPINGPLKAAQHNACDRFFILDL
ncbi:GNAT family N-acetyltransferase [Fructobacillus sp. CRL 2054]|uniref:GNAT family N-acetyltransferase n=1 Tax=Fructobacillus sp. CRL 2054 TaxID=2763007 RepID=UPI00237898E8|nr:GNAT family N-acetyltransferase [Fructobacillus sp. CRL 2054]MDD9138922.1 GNAT family N-acetyltransferase [Fructobacillus sp. CRL 2054]